MYCSKCGNKIEDNASFCPICGNRIDVRRGTGSSYKPDPLENNSFMNNPFEPEKNMEPCVYGPPPFPGGGTSGRARIRIAVVLAVIVVIAIVSIALFVRIY